MATRFDRTFGTATSRKIMTFSFWCKRAKILNSAYYFPIFHMAQSGIYTLLDFNDTYNLRVLDSNGTDLVTTRLFRDTSAWYHIVVSIDTTQATASNRIKMYVNGVQETLFGTATYPSLNADMSWNNNVLNSIGQHSSALDYYYDGLLASVYFIDGQALTQTSFGKTDATTGIWKPKSYSGSYGTNGFFLKFENSGSLGTDSSGNGNNFSIATGTPTQTIDTPSNVFCTLNPLYGNGSYSFEHGNNSLEGNNTNNWGIAVPATLGATSGKYYWEVKQVAGSHTDYNLFGFIQTDYSYIGSNLISTEYLNGIQTHSSTTVTVYNGANATTYLAIGGSQVSVSDNDIVSFALDLDNQKCWVAKNGVWSDDLNGNVGNPSTGANALWTSSVIPSGQVYSPVSIQYYDPKCQYNFGNGYFGTTAVSSAENPDDGIGIFEYEVPAGYKALCTKSINAQEYN